LLKAESSARLWYKDSKAVKSYLPLTLLGFEPGLVALHVEGLQGQWHQARQQLWGLEEPILKI
jgi:hypothetical protein